MGSSNVPTPVFIHTNLGTRFALPVSPDITAYDFKRELEGMHLNCFPEFGSIRVNALMVKQKSHYYYLSESLPLKYAFLGSNVSWFLHINVHMRSIRNHVESLKCNDTEVHNLESNVDSVELGGFMMSAHDKRTKCKRKKVKIKRFPYLNASVLKISAVVCFLNRKRKREKVTNQKFGCPEQGLVENEMLCQFPTRAEVKCRENGDKNVIAEAPSETFSEPASVSGIIKKYFTDYDEVASSFPTVRSRHREWLNSSNEHRYSNIQSPQVPQDMWLEKSFSEASKDKRSKPEVGKRLLLASDGLGLTPGKKQSVLSLCKYTDGKSPFQKSSGPVRNLVFEMTE